MNGITKIVVFGLIAATFAFAMPDKASAQYGFGFNRGFGGFGIRGLIRNRVIQNNLNQQALRQIALQNSLNQNRVVVNSGFRGVNVAVNSGFGNVRVNSGLNSGFHDFRNNGIIPGRTEFIVNGRRSIVAIDDQRGTFVNSGGVLVRVR